MSFETTSRLSPAKRYALLIIDMSVGFTDPDQSPLAANCPGVINDIASLIRKFRVLGLPIIYTTVSYEDDEEAQVFRQKIPQLNCLRKVNNLHSIDPRVAPREGEPVVIKKWASAFFGTDLDQRLRQAGIDGVFVTGLTTSGCVRASVVDAIQHGYKPVVVESAVGDRDHAAHVANLRDIATKYGDVMALGEALQTLSQATGDAEKSS